MTKQSPAMQVLVDSIQRWLKTREYMSGYGFPLYRCHDPGKALCRTGVVSCAGGGCVIDAWTCFTTQYLRRLFAQAKKAYTQDRLEKLKSSKGTIIIGTSHFVSFKAACKYYSAQEGWDGIYRLVKSKEAEGLIKIGAPLIKQGQRLKIVDNGTRYAIEEI